MVTPACRAPRRAFAAACLIAAAVVMAVTQESGPVRPGPSDEAAGATAGGSSWARTAGGGIVPVTPAHIVTPVHPEALTHPDSDAMGGLARSQPARQLTAATKPLGADPSVVPNPISPDSAVRQLPGIDVSSHQGALDWAAIAPHIDFVYAKATEGTYYLNGDFANQYNGPYDAGLIRGAYHFAIPNNSSGTAQADYFLKHGGAWSSDGRTLPGALDIEYNPYGAACYGLTANQMVAWIDDFVTEYAAKTHAYPVIYSTTNWWDTCTGGSAAFSNLDPFWVADYNANGGGALPGRWGFYTFWQYADSGSVPGDQDLFNGAPQRLKTLATDG
jgi:GH25 family lysozyme M1 (1,4-beta-N-acetylmuramidase)